MKRFISLPIWMLALATSVASADPIVFNTSPYTGTGGIGVEVTFATTGMADQVKATVTVQPSPNTGDLRGLFLNWDSGQDISSLLITGSDVTVVNKDIGNVTSAGLPSNNTNPEGPFDIGISIGTPGIGGNDIQTTMIFFDYAGFPGGEAALLDALTSKTDPATPSGPNELILAVRVTSVGLEDGDRSGSSKLGVTEDGGGPIQVFPVPEPHSVLVWGVLGLLALGMAAGRRRRRQAA